MKLSYTYDSNVFATADTDRYKKKEEQEALTLCLQTLADALGINIKSVGYLLQNGWSQSLQDSYAGPRAKAIKDGESESRVLEVILACLQKRTKAIRDGALSATPGGGRDPIKSVGLQMLESFVASKNKSMPRDKDKRAALLDSYIKQNRAAIDAEIAKRKAAKGAEITIDDLLQ